MPSYLEGVENLCGLLENSNALAFNILKKSTLIFFFFLLLLSVLSRSIQSETVDDSDTLQSDKADKESKLAKGRTLMHAQISSLSDRRAARTFL